MNIFWSDLHTWIPCIEKLATGSQCVRGEESFQNRNLSTDFIFFPHGLIFCESFSSTLLIRQPYKISGSVLPTTWSVKDLLLDVTAFASCSSKYSCPAVCYLCSQPCQGSTHYSHFGVQLQLLEAPVQSLYVSPVPSTRITFSDCTSEVYGIFLNIL